MQKTKNEIQKALKLTHTTLYDAKDDPRNKNHIQLRPAMSLTINFSPYIREFIEIEIIGRA